MRSASGDRPRGRAASRHRPTRPSAGRAAAPGGSGRRRVVALLAALALGVGGGFVLTRLDVDETLTELTLPLRHDDIIRQQATEKDLDSALIAAVIYAESRFRDQTSHAGARGLMQITPKTAKAIEELSGGTTFVTEDLADPDINIRYGSFYLAYLLQKYGGNEVAALAAYNAGETQVDEWGGAEVDTEDVVFDETHSYVEDVLEKREQYRDNYAEDLGL
jgi:soluble lytic murein transglycosylase